jgi:hypothetical protein
VDYGVLRRGAVVHVVVYDGFGLDTSLTRYVFCCKQCTCLIVYDTTTYDRNTIHRMCALRPVNDRNYNVCGRSRQRKRPYTFVYDRHKHRPGTVFIINGL